MLREKENWKLRKDFKRGKFCFLIGVNDWSIELQKKEFKLLYFLIKKITNELLEIQDNLMDEELITLEVEQLPWYLELEGKKEFKLLYFFNKKKLRMNY